MALRGVSGLEPTWAFLPLYLSYGLEAGQAESQGSQGNGRGWRQEVGAGAVA